MPDIAYYTGKVLRYQRGNQKPILEEEQTIQWAKV